MDRTDSTGNEVAFWPVMGGRPLIELIRQRLPFVKILVMSGYTEDAILRHGIFSSEADFLQKPFNAVA